MVDFLSNCGELISLIVNGVANFVDFFVGLPSFVYSLVETIPRPIYDVLLSFVSLIIFCILLSVLGKIVSSYKGG